MIGTDQSLTSIARFPPLLVALERSRQHKDRPTKDADEREKTVSFKPKHDYRLCENHRGITRVSIVVQTKTREPMNKRHTV